MTASDNYRFTDPLLQAVVSATDLAISQMNRVNSAVLGISAQLPVANFSPSGRRLAARLSDWNIEFKPIEDELRELHTKAKFLLDKNRRVALETEQQS